MNFRNRDVSDLGVFKYQSFNGFSSFYRFNHHIVGMSLIFKHLSLLTPTGVHFKNQCHGMAMCLSTVFCNLCRAVDWSLDCINSMKWPWIQVIWKTLCCLKLIHNF